MLRKLHGKLSNREIIVVGVITFLFWSVVGFHWHGLVWGVIVGVMVSCMFRKEINANYRIKPSIVRFFNKGKVNV